MAATRTAEFAMKRVLMLRSIAPRGFGSACLISTDNKSSDDVIKARDTAIRADHFAIPTEFPSKSFDGSNEISVDAFYRKRLIYRAKQRGWQVFSRFARNSS